jgi:hypothetical protein
MKCSVFKSLLIVKLRSYCSTTEESPIESFDGVPGSYQSAEHHEDAYCFIFWNVGRLDMHEALLQYA